VFQHLRSDELGLLAEQKKKKESRDVAIARAGFVPARLNRQTTQSLRTDAVWHL